MRLKKPAMVRSGRFDALAVARGSGSGSGREVEMEKKREGNDGKAGES